ncbi:Helix-turn-helix domain-containing protein [Actinopolymorpha cephalotaxi]|uniref:Helix-turn-helix domain-containing protein n=1 Tax=Actinopolymorpha cephalotaxi TaxID=504797 RepID=A0A1I2M4X4_9ACTN|nr:helix-turn-helix transcriptional regulator [Actinopolymorpha cephalotaxi]NYH81504.1 transcriptional regulator with XRE-family HTH domain [Actinopolymorpha cephalotaxi]SFF84291.1 Helix-turn-helix domain-containing protein [Actinopolymorpha cephalotaxi]
MPRVTGPTISRWRLSKELKRLREEAGRSFDDSAELLGCSPSKIRKIEAGEVGVVKAELDLLLDLYKVDDEQLASLLRDLQKLGKQRGWWAPLGSLPKQYSVFVGLESEALRIRQFEPLVLPGLLQTEEYASALDAMCTFLTADEQARAVKVRMARQEQFWAEGADDDRSRLWVIVDEAALRRPVGGNLSIMRGQLLRVLELAERCIFQVVPFEAGSYPGTSGPFTIFDFDEDVHSPVVFTDGHAGIALLESEADVDRGNRAFAHMAAVALSPTESARKVVAIASEMATQQGGENES